jgi:uncharacterized membrane protein YfcA
VTPQLLVAAGLLIGLLYGLFGVGSAFATPLLALLGVPAPVAVAAPLPGLVPGSVAGAWAHVRARRVDWDLVRWTVAGGLPGTIAGGLLSRVVGGQGLLLLSGVMLFAVGWRVLRVPSASGDPEAVAAVTTRRRRPAVVVAMAFAVGAFAGLLSNGGGFLLVPLFLCWFGLTMPEASGTAMVCVAALSLPAVLTHAALGDIDWSVAVLFGAGVAPGAAAGSRLALRVPADRLRKAFGLLIVGFAVWFVAHQSGLT